MGSQQELAGCGRAPVLERGRQEDGRRLGREIDRFAAHVEGDEQPPPPVAALVGKNAVRRGNGHIAADGSGLIRFLDDGRLELDTNPVENQIRPIALTRKNALFAGNEVGAENWAMLASLVATCKMSDVNPVDYIAATLRAVLDGHPKAALRT
jgi:hypothetical protein